MLRMILAAHGAKLATKIIFTLITLLIAMLKVWHRRRTEKAALPKISVIGAGQSGLSPFSRSGPFHPAVLEEAVFEPRYDNSSSRLFSSGEIKHD